MSIVNPSSQHPYIKDSKVEVCRGVDRQSTQESCRWGGEGRGGAGEGRGLIDIQLRKVVGGEEGEARGGEVGSIDAHLGKDPRSFW